MKDKFSNIISLDEFRMASLVVVLFAIVASIICSYFLIGGVIASPLVSLTETLIYAISGVHIASVVSRNFTGNNVNVNASTPIDSVNVTEPQIQLEPQQQTQTRQDSDVPDLKI